MVSYTTMLNTLGLFVFIYTHWQARFKQTVRQNYEKKYTTETKWVIFQQWCKVYPACMCIKNYSHVYKEISALSVTD